jgi:hypothetical protein
MRLGFHGRMSDHRPASDGRNAVRRRVGRVTATLAAASVAVTGSIAAYLAGTGTGHRSVNSSTSTSPATSVHAEVPVPAAPAAPSLDSTGSSSSQAPTQSAPIQPPTQSSSPPVAVSGGS